MKFSEFLIIYLALGLSFGFHYLLNNHKWSFGALTKSFVIFVFWPFYGFQIVSRSREKSFSLRDERETLRIQKRLEDSIKEEGLNIFEVREIISRYVGLTLAEKECMNWEVGAELLKLSNHPNPELGIKCLQRRNFERIGTHRNKASEAFVNVILPLVYNEDVYQLSLRLAESLKDDKTAQKIRERYSMTQKLWEEAKVEEKELAIR